jgi:ABC-2 type transport system permease protein
MNGFLYDIKRTLTGKFTIILIVLLVLVTAATAYGAGSSADSAAPAHTDIVLPYVNDTGGYVHVSDYIINGYGQPVNGLTITSSLENCSDHTYLNKTLTSVNGYINFKELGNPSSQYKYGYNAYYKDGNPVAHSSISLILYTDGSMYLNGNYMNINAYPVYFNYSNEPIYAVLLKDKANPSQVSTMLYIPHANRTTSNYPLYISQNTSSSPIYEISKYNITANSVKDTSNTGMFIYTPHLTPADRNTYVNIYVTNSTGAVVVPNISFYYTYAKPGTLLQSDLALFFGMLLIPIMAIFSAYFYYSKDKASGVMESIIARPITKGKLMISRLTGNSISFLVGLLISFGLADIILEHYTGVYMTTGTLATMLLGYLVEAIGFAGIMYLVTQFAKTQGIILGIGIGLLFILGFMWTIITEALLFELHITSTTPFLKDSLILSSISPSYFPDIIADYHLGVYSTVSASSVGINIYSVALIGLAWVLIPSLLAFYFARKRD